jgi:hypothetical protein
MGLNHMNGRVEDAILGRFLSPDPHIPDPSNAQSYNRYSYVNNNPLTNVDPTGFVGCRLNAPVPYGPRGRPLAKACPIDLTSGPDLNPSYGAGPYYQGLQGTLTYTWTDGSGDVFNTVSVPGSLSDYLDFSADYTSPTSGFQIGGFNDPDVFSVKEALNGPVFYNNTTLLQSAGATTALDNDNFFTVVGLADAMSEATSALTTAASFAEAWSSSVGEFAHDFGLAGTAFGTVLDITSASNGGISRTQAGLNLAVGAAVAFGGELAVLPAAQYFLFNALTNRFYPGGSQQAWADVGVSLNDMAENGLGP